MSEIPTPPTDRGSKSLLCNLQSNFHRVALHVVGDPRTHLARLRDRLAERGERGLELFLRLDRRRALAALVALIPCDLADAFSLGHKRPKSFGIVKTNMP